MKQVLFHSGAARPQLRPHPYLNLPHVLLSSFPLSLPPILLPEPLNKSYAPESLSWAPFPGNLNYNSLGCCIKLLSSSHSTPDTALSPLKRGIRFILSSVQFNSVAQSCPTLCNPMNRSTPGLPVHHQLPEFTQTRVNQVGDAIQPSHPLLAPSPPAPNPSQHQSLFQ